MNRRSGIGGVGPAVGSMVVGSEKGVCLFFCVVQGESGGGLVALLFALGRLRDSFPPVLVGGTHVVVQFSLYRYCYCNNFIHTNHGGPLQKQEADRPLLTHSKLHCSQCPVTKYASLTTPFITNKPHAWTEYAGTK